MDLDSNVLLNIYSFCSFCGSGGDGVCTSSFSDDHHCANRRTAGRLPENT